MYVNDGDTLLNLDLNQSVGRVQAILFASHKCTYSGDDAMQCRKTCLLKTI